MRIISEEELQSILRLHDEWICDETNGQRAIFSGIDLSGIDFIAIDLYRADLRGAKFTTEMMACHWLDGVLCDDDQLPWLILHPTFSRRFE